MFGLEGHNQNISVVDVRQSASVDENHPSKKHLWEYNKTTVNKSEFSRKETEFLKGQIFAKLRAQIFTTFVHEFCYF